MNLNEIVENYSDQEFLKADGFDDAIIGIEPNSMKLVYDISIMVESLIKNDEMTYEDAMEYLNFNVFCAYVGEKTPIYIQTNLI